MRISQLEYLKAIKNYGSISQAALELYISQSTISKAIKELEEELGVEILTRTKKGAIFTPFGEDILKSAEKIMVEIDKIKDVKYTAKDSIKGHLKLGAGSHFCASILTDIIIDIETQYKNVRFSLCREYSKDLLKEICQGKVDIALIQLNTFDMEDIKTEIKRNELIYEELHDSALFFVAAKNHPLHMKKSIMIKDLIPYKIVTIKKKLDDFTYNALKKEGYNQEFICIEDVVCMRRYAQEMNAVLIVPAEEIEKSNDSYKIQMHKLDIKDFKNKLKIGLVYKEKSNNLLFEMFVERVRKYIL